MGMLARHARNDTPAAARTRHRFWRRFRDRAGAVGGVLLVALAAYTALVQYESNSAQAAITACQNAANHDFAVALQERGTASRALNDAQRTFLHALTATDMQRADALAVYFRALDVLDATQAAHPLVIRDCSRKG